MPYALGEAVPRVPCLMLKSGFIWDEVNVQDPKKPKFQIGQIIVFNGSSPFKMLARQGAMARVEGYAGEWVEVKWLDSPLRNGQNDSVYPEGLFDLAPPTHQKPLMELKLNEEVIRDMIFQEGFPATVAYLHGFLQKSVEALIRGDFKKNKVEIKMLPAPKDEHSDPARQ